MFSVAQGIRNLKTKKTYTLYIIAKKFYKTVNNLLQFRQRYLPCCIIHDICVHCVYIYNLQHEIFYLRITKKTKNFFQFFLKFLCQL